jgi:serine/threonine protein kinase
MGCAVSGANNRSLRDAKDQVDELGRKLRESEASNKELHKRLEAFEISKSTVSDEATKLPEAEQVVTIVAPVATADTVAAEEVACTSVEEAVPVVTVAAPEATADTVAVDEAGDTSMKAPILPGAVPCEAVAEPAEELSTANEALPPLSGETATPPDEHVASEEEEEVLDCPLSAPLTEILETPLEGCPDVYLEPPEEVLPDALQQEAPQEEAPVETLLPPKTTSCSQEDSGKFSTSMASTASTCTPAAAGASHSLAICHGCSCEAVDLYVDSTDNNRYCERCWVEYYGQPPTRELQPLIHVEVQEYWYEDRLAQIWSEHLLPGWPPPVALTPTSSLNNEGELWSNVSVRVRRDIVGSHAREQCHGDRPYPGEVLAGRYRVKNVVGEGHFTKAFLADDLTTGAQVCLKRHRSLTVEALADLVVIGRRIEDIDAGGYLFPRLLDAFYDLATITVESLIKGRNCLAVMQRDPTFFHQMGNLRCVAQGALDGLAHLDRVAIVHNDVKPDNLLWVEAPLVAGLQVEPSFVRIVDFGCARLDQREEPGRNWSLAEGGAGHLGKWSPEMTLRLPITTRGDVWGLAVSLCELHCGRFVWRNEADTAEVVLAQALGLCGLVEGLPSSLLRRSPLDVRLLYTPAPYHLPLRRNNLGQLEALRPAAWGLDQILGMGWRRHGKGDFGDFLQAALIIDPLHRPSAAQLLERCKFVTFSTDEPSASSSDEGAQATVDSCAQQEGDP